MKAIETTYGGVKFRSRLEARWALVLDKLHVEWRYEHEGYELESGRYLPDFWLPDLRDGTWLEIKPAWPTETEIMLCWELAIHTQKRCVLAVDFDSILVFPPDGPPQDGPPLTVEASREFLIDLVKAWLNKQPPIPCLPGNHNKMQRLVNAVVRAEPFHAAIESARSHRFWDPS